MSSDKSLSDKLKKLGEKVNKYKKFGLSDNPFPARPIATAETVDEGQLAKIFCEEIRAKETERIYEILIEPSYSSSSETKSNTTNVWLEGNPGIGKSILFLHLMSQLRKHRPDVVAFYVEIKREGFKLLWEELLLKRNTGSSFFRDIALKIAVRIVLDNPELVDKDETVLKELKRDAAAIENLLPIETMGRDEIEQELVIDIDLLSQLMKRRLAEEGVTTKLKDSLVEMLTDPVTGYNLLYKVPSTYRSKAVSEFFKVIKLAGYRMAYLFIDQLDYVFRYVRATGSQTESIKNDLRKLANEANIASVGMTTYPDLSPDFKADPQIMAGFPLNKYTVVEIGPLNGEQAKNLAIRYLESVKTKDSIPGLYPFTEPAVERICDFAQGRTREIIVYLRGLLMSAADNPKIKTIDIDFVTQLLETEGPKWVESAEPEETLEERFDELG